MFYDEADATPASVIRDMMSAIEGYTAKNNPFTVINSTAMKVGGLMQQIEDQKDET